jgi:hypothetical protein
MQKKMTIRTALVAALFMLCVALGAQFQAVALAQGATAPPSDPSAEAKRLLGQMDRAKLATIRDTKARADFLAGYDALKAVADNTSKTREKVLLAKFHRATLKLKADVPPKAGVTFNDCDAQMKRCLEQGTPPEYCQLSDDGCAFMALISIYFPEGAPEP